VQPEEAALLNGILKREYSERISETGVRSHAQREE
jgi:hypothetical protein